MIDSGSVLPPTHDEQCAVRFPNRATCWRLRSRALEFTARPLLMGIVNVTPDSFSDGGRFFDPAAAVDRCLQLIADGADLLDIGGESTRPYSRPVSPDEETRRVFPVIEQLAQQTDTPISIDTSKAEVARIALEAGAEIINDVTGLEGDPAMMSLAASTGAGVCVMHMQGTPQTMQDNPVYDDVLKNVFEYLSQRRDTLVAAGIEPARICLDPGIGFGKTTEHNLALLANCRQLHSARCPILVGHSRKGFLGKVLGDMEADRTTATIGVALGLVSQGVQVLRVHDVRPVREALTLFAATVAPDA